MAFKCMEKCMSFLIFLLNSLSLEAKIESNKCTKALKAVKELAKFYLQRIVVLRA